LRVRLIPRSGGFTACFALSYNVKLQSRTERKKSPASARVCAQTRFSCLEASSSVGWCATAALLPMASHGAARYAGRVLPRMSTIRLPEGPCTLGLVARYVALSFHFFLLRRIVVQEFEYFSLYLRGREELLVTVYQPSDNATPSRNAFVPSPSPIKMMLETRVPPASPAAHEERRPDSESVFLLGG
jgi:hypothetical protein